MRTYGATGLRGFLFLAIIFSALAGRTARGGELFLSELFFNPPGADSPSEYIEIRGTPNRILPRGTFLLTVEGDAGNNPGVIQNVFDLSGKTIGGNGFTVLLQNGNPYVPDYSASVYANTNTGSGWGSGLTSGVEHAGRDSLTDLKNPSVTFLLVRSPEPIIPGEDVDVGNDGVMDSASVSKWIIDDAVGVLDGDGAGDIAYGLVNFRVNSFPGNGATASGVVIPVPFTPRYVGRNGNSTNWSSSAWVASDVTGSAPDWILGAADKTYPQTLAGVSLNHLGSPNFGAQKIPGVLVIPASDGIQVVEGGDPGSFSLALNTPPSGPIVVQITSDSPLQISTNQETGFKSEGIVTFRDTNRQSVFVKALDDEFLSPSPSMWTLRTTLLGSGDLGHYPLTSLTPQIPVGVLENDFALLNEANLNPPGTNDAPYEYVELRGTPRVLLRHLQILMIDAESNPGQVLFQANLDGDRLGNDGFLLIASTNAGFAPAGFDGFHAEPEFDKPGGALPNRAFTFLLLQSPEVISIGQDLDPADEGNLTALPAGAAILDSLAFVKDGGTYYSQARLQLKTGLPDAAGRIANHLEPNSAAAWVYGELLGPEPGSLFYSDRSDERMTAGTRLTPGYGNLLAPKVIAPTAISGVIGDPTNPKILLSATDAETAYPLTLWVESSNAGAAASSTLSLVLLSNNTYQLSIDPVGVGYSDISVFSTDGGATGRTTFAYAASAPGRPGGIWHLGASDSSAGVPVDSDYVWLADDENQTLRLYPRNESSLPLRHLDLTPFLDLPDLGSGTPREVDFEAATRSGDLLLWIGSHGHGATGEPRTNRTRLVATRLQGTGADSSLSYAGRYDFLKVDLIEWDNQNRHGKGASYYGLEASDADGVPPKAPDGSGFAIEGLTMIPGSTNAGYLAFRAPIVPATNRTFALIVPVLNLVSLATSEGPPGSAVFGSPIELDLYGRGIRSIEGDSNGFLIVGGPASAGIGLYPQDFRLYTWNGNVEKNSDQRAVDLFGLNPEGIINLPEPPWNAESLIEVVSDNGTSVFYGDGIAAKELPIRNFKKSRSDRIKLGAVTKPVPIIISIERGEFSTGITWRSLKGESYRLQYSTDLAPGSWQDIPGDVVALGPFARKAIPGTGRSGFYRVMLPGLAGL